MRHYPKFEALRKRDRERILEEYPGFLERIAKKTGKTKATASRVFNGLIRRSPEVKQAIEEELNAIEQEAPSAA